MWCRVCASSLHGASQCTHSVRAEHIIPARKSHVENDDEIDEKNGSHNRTDVRNIARCHSPAGELHDDGAFHEWISYLQSVGCCCDGDVLERWVQPALERHEWSEYRQWQYRQSGHIPADRHWHTGGTARGRHVRIVHLADDAQHRLRHVFGHDLRHRINRTGRKFQFARLDPESDAEYRSRHVLAHFRQLRARGGTGSGHPDQQLTWHQRTHKHQRGA